MYRSVRYEKPMLYSIIIVSLYLLIYYLSTLSAEMSKLETKICNSLRIAKNKISNFENKEIKGIYNLIEDRENFVVINISDDWYVLAIDTYDEMENSNDNSQIMEIDGWRYTLKAQKGDIAKAPDLLVDMAKSHIDDYKNDIDIELLNKALGLKYAGNS